jgi:hypothetical protein
MLFHALVGIRVDMERDVGHVSFMVIFRFMYFYDSIFDMSLGVPERVPLFARSRPRAASRCPHAVHVLGSENSQAFSNLKRRELVRTGIVSWIVKILTGFADADPAQLFIKA